MSEQPDQIHDEYELKPLKVCYDSMITEYMIPIFVNGIDGQIREEYVEK